MRKRWRAGHAQPPEEMTERGPHQGLSVPAGRGQGTDQAPLSGAESSRTQGQKLVCRKFHLNRGKSFTARLTRRSRGVCLLRNTQELHGRIPVPCAPGWSAWSREAGPGVLPRCLSNLTRSGILWLGLHFPACCAAPGRCRERRRWPGGRWDAAVGGGRHLAWPRVPAVRAQPAVAAGPSAEPGDSAGAA